MRVGRAVALALCAALSATACGNDDEATGCAAQDDPALAVDQIGAALAAVEAELGAAPQLFEVNATDVVVNLFVAGTAADGTPTATPYAFARGELVGEDPLPAQGATFGADAVRIDPARVLSCVAEEVPGSTLTGFVVEGGPGGAVRYTVVITSSQGGQLLAEVAGDGQVRSVQVV